MKMKTRIGRCYIMDFNSFKVLYAEVMMNYELLEYDIKYIYSFMREGNLDDNLYMVKNNTLGEMIKLLKELDHSEDYHFISAKDYALLDRLCTTRNHWSHKTLSNFMYEKGFLESEEYKKECKKLQDDYKKIENALDILEDVKIEYCSELPK